MRPAGAGIQAQKSAAAGAALAPVALGLMTLLYSRQLLWSAGLGRLDLLDETGLGVARLRSVIALEWYAWKILALATVSAVVLALPLPASWGQRVLAVAVVMGLALSTFMVWLFTGLRFN